MRCSYAILIAAAMAAATALVACEKRPTPLPAQLERGPGEQPPIPDPDRLPELPGQLVFTQAGEVVRWPPQGGEFEVLAQAEFVGALEVAESGIVAAYLQQDPDVSVRNAELHVIDLAGRKPVELAVWPVQTRDDFRLDSSDTQGARLAVAADGSRLAWLDAGPNRTVWEWVVGERAPRIAGSTDDVSVRDGKLAFGEEPNLDASAAPAPRLRGLTVAAHHDPLVVFSDGVYGQDEFTAILGRTDTGERWDLSGLLYGARLIRLAGAPTEESR